MPALAPPNPVLALSPTIRVEEVATRAQLANATNATNTQIMSRSGHIARQTLTSLQAAFGNFYVKAGTGELGNGTAATVTATVEYPVGTIDGRFTFSASNTGSIPSAGYLLSDSTSLSTPIPNGAMFWIREYFTNTAGIFYVQYTAANAVSAFDTMTYGTSVTDQTASGTVANTSNNFALTPVAIVAPSVLPALCFVGDSRVQGLQDVRSDATGDGGNLARYYGPRFAYISMGIPSDTAASVNNGSWTNRVALNHYCSVTINELGVNDINGGASAATVVTNRTAVDALFSPFTKLYGTTLEPISSSTDSWASASGQSASNNPVRLTFNASVRSGIAGEAGYIDLGDMADPTRSGIWPTNGTALAFTPDGIHETAIQNTAQAQSGLWPNLDFSRN